MVRGFILVKCVNGNSFDMLKILGVHTKRAIKTLLRSKLKYILIKTNLLVQIIESCQLCVIIICQHDVSYRFRIPTNFRNKIPK